MEQNNRPTSRTKTVVSGTSTVERRNNETTSGSSASSRAEQNTGSKSTDSQKK